MSANSSKSAPLFGFLSVVDLGGSSWIGGYLLLNALGRPIEFHCTEPVKANRAQQILFGETLPAFVCGEQIGKALVENSSVKPVMILTNQLGVLAVREFTLAPVACVASAETPVPAGHLQLALADVRVWLDQRHADDQERLQQAWTQVAANWDLQEPFQRIQEAVAELQKAA